MGRVIEVAVECVVRIEVSDEDAITRVTGLAGDEWREHLYRDVTTEDDVVEHWAYNAVANGVSDASRLDGWTDMDRDAVRMSVDGVEAARIDSGA